MKARPLTIAGVVVGAVALATSVSSAARPVPGRASVAEQSACTGDAGQALVRTFTAAYSKGRLKAALRAWAREPLFQWFSAGKPGQRAGAEAHNRATLRAYFRRRIRVHERLSLIDLGARYDPARRIVNFGGTLVRSADGLSPRSLPFKGAAACRSGRLLLIVWSM